MTLEISFRDFNKDYKIDVLMLVTTQLELDETLKYLAPFEEDGDIYKIYNNSLTYYTGTYGKYSTAIVKANTMGSTMQGASIQTTSEAIDTCLPKIVIMTGIAFGKDDKKQKIADIIVAKSICQYEPSRVSKEGVENRGSIVESDMTLYNRFSQNSSFKFEWDGQLHTSKIIPGPILSGEKLVDNVDFKSELFSYYPHAVGGEMEGTGFYAACSSKKKPCVLIKAICDWGDGFKDKKFQPLAASASASFVRESLQSDYIFSNLEIKPFFERVEETPEIKIDAFDVVRLLTPRLSLNKVLDTRKRVKDSEKKIYYEYYLHEDRGRLECFLFLGRNISIKQTLSHLIENNDIPEYVSVFITKKFSKNKLVERKRGILERAHRLGINQLSKNDIRFIDEFIWECTHSMQCENSSAFRSDYIDQKLYTFDPRNNIADEVGNSTDFFLDQFKSKSIPLSLILGGGGVGKTTFSLALRAVLDEQSTTFKRRVLLIKGERIAKYKITEESVVESLRDLYDLCKDDEDFTNIRSDEFELNYMCGNVIVVIDGLDEIDSALGQNFNIEKFFQSLSSLEERFYSTNIIITSRDYFLEKLNNISDTLDVYKLKGFTDVDLDNYLAKRFAEDDNGRRSEVKKFLLKDDLFQNSHLAPLLADWACEIIKRQMVSKQCRLTHKESKYLFSNAKIDTMLMDLIDRENDKQSIDVSVDDIFELLIELVVIHKGHMSITDLDEYIATTFNEDLDKFLKSPLLDVRKNNHVTIKYDALSVIVKARYIHSKIMHGGSFSDSLIDILKDNYVGKSVVLEDAAKRIKSVDSTFLNNSISILHKLCELYSKSEKLIEKKNLQKAVSGLLYLVFEVENPNDKADRTKLLFEIYRSKTNISHLFVFGDFYSFDFMNTVISNSMFDGFCNFSNCTFSDNESTRFMYSEFKNINFSKRTTVKRINFDSSCKFVNCNIEEILKTSENQQEEAVKQVQNNFISITKFLDTSNQSVNRIKLKCNIKWPQGEKAFIKKLVSEGYLESKRLKGHNLYGITKTYFDSIPSIKVGCFPVEIEKLINSISK